MILESPQSFVTRQECDKVTYQNGFRRPHGEIDGWQRYSSTTAQGSIWLARDTSGAWLLALDHAGVIAEIGIEASYTEGPGLARFRFASLPKLYGVMPRVYELAASLPDAPLQEFLHRTKNLPKTTEAERLVFQRVGQNIFRERRIKYWQGRCPLTGIVDKPLLRASHTKPWRDCEKTTESVWMSIMGCFCQLFGMPYSMAVWLPSAMTESRPFRTTSASRRVRDFILISQSI